MADAAALARLGEMTSEGRLRLPSGLEATKAYEGPLDIDVGNMIVSARRTGRG